MVCFLVVVGFGKYGVVVVVILGGVVIEVGLVDEDFYVVVEYIYVIGGVVLGEVVVWVIVVEYVGDEGE